MAVETRPSGAPLRINLNFMPHRKEISGFSCSLESLKWFQAKVHVHEPELRRFLRSRYGIKDTKDLIHDAYYRLFRMKGAKDITDMRAYLYTMVKNLATDQVRKTKAAPIDPVPSDSIECIENAPCAAELASKNQERTLLDSAMDSLPERCRIAMRLHLMESLTQRATAARMGITERAVSDHIRLGVSRLHGYLSARRVSPNHRDAGR
jgi:RNA polymerase sigma factor (sigma-70 family)